jgi:hypothetical protein
MIKKIGKFNLFLLGFILLNILQSYFTPLIPDEAYYWVYSHHLDWGYFDHPPMVALIIKIGSLLFNNELGVRFMSIILNAFMVLIIWQLIPKKNKEHKYAEILFFGILFSIPLFHVYSFITTPDTPLLFSFALYLFALKKLSEKNKLIYALFLGFSAALMIYSKYHGGILILLSILLQPQLLRKKTTYYAGFFALILVSPHIYWLYQHDFITFKYHLFQRTDGHFKINQVLEYVSGTFGVLNPALLLLLIVYLIKDKNLISNSDRFYFRVFYAFIIFFFFYSFRARIEAHWVAAAYIPLSIIVYNIASNNSKFFKPLRYSIGIVALLIFLLRIIPILNLSINTPFHTKGKEYYQEIDSIANGRKVIFMNSYQQASKYSFYTKKESFSLNSIYHRKNQYDLLDTEKYFHNQPVFIVRHHKSSKFDSIKLRTGDEIYFKIIDKFPVFSKLKAEITVLNNRFFTDKPTNISIKIKNPYDYSIDFERKENLYQLSLFFINENAKTLITIDKKLPKLNTNQVFSFDTKVNLKDFPKGKYKLFISLKSGILQAQQISKFYWVEVK